MQFDGILPTGAWPPGRMAVLPQTASYVSGVTFVGVNILVVWLASLLQLPFGQLFDQRVTGFVFSIFCRGAGGRQAHRGETRWVMTSIQMVFTSWLFHCSKSQVRPAAKDIVDKAITIYVN